ncbi:MULTISPECIES: hypothetical protein [Acidobacterium]|uniref:Uncharacterized protein n=1 Tax=Acidobacterium capsulatum (strain ATCC 51196 / DSM 11244 / BCRC 80197 / JCM 7670 / NBRC 15755 / NCIMB 13165 / 161) TaxID=240015 RepID=C1F826_ACIC5|nr:MULTISPECIES: hypothetical protein [Acidobacterium]ACO32597.1 hypothetical protein ACP_0070 [Acidobacterium capsulatum ATCC 51196]HCT59277.1 hypothetical protein [Acidobacterium sp.]
MQPAKLKADDFSHYPPEARALAVRHLALIQQLPLAFAALLMREVQQYDWRFPAERRVLDDQFSYLDSLSSSDRESLLRGFAGVQLPEKVMRIDWVRQPQDFLNALTACLWSTHQIDGFRQTAEAYTQAWRKARPEPQPAMPRLSIVVLGTGLYKEDYALFRKLRPEGMYFPKVTPGQGWQAIVAAAQKRASAHPEPYRHWYVEGATADPALASTFTSTSYDGMSGARQALLTRVQKIIASGDGGPEKLRTAMAMITPEQLGMQVNGQNEALRRFEADVLTEGSGTQIFSTTFVQWTAREALRRAQPYTLVLRYAPRQRKLPMNVMLSGDSQQAGPDAAGSLMDADIGAFYTWLNQQRLTGAGESSLLAWSEEHQQAVAVGPALPRGTVAASEATVQQMLAMLTS